VVAQAGRAEVLKAMGQFHEALAAYDEVRVAHPDNVVAQAGRAEVLKAMGQFREALAAYDEVRAAHPDNVVARNGRASLLAAMGRDEEALAGLPTSAPSSFEDWIAAHVRTMVYLRNNRLEEAEAMINDALASCSFGLCKPYFHSALTLLRMKQERLSEAAAAASLLAETPLSTVGQALLVELEERQGEESPVGSAERQDHLDTARRYFQLLPKPNNELAREYYELAREYYTELDRIVVQHLPALQSRAWRDDRAIRNAMSLSSMAS
jgi:tetratricopeptide (TPR) repeat protein